MNPCELVARLNPKSSNLEGARGGMPEYTQQDLAAALGMVQDTFAREVFCAVWWADGARLAWKELDAFIASMQLEEWRERADALLDAQIAVAQATNDFRKYDLGKARAMQERAKLRIWPALGEQPFTRIRAATIAELRSNRICSSCNGRREVKTGQLVVICGACNATGRTPVSDMQRAALLERNESSYRRTWRTVYEWTFDKVQRAETAGRAAFLKMLGADPE